METEMGMEMSISFYQVILAIGILFCIVAILYCFLHSQKDGSIRPLDVVMASASVFALLLWIIPHELNMFSLQLDQPAGKYLSTYFSSGGSVVYKNEWSVLYFMFTIYIGVVIIDLAMRAYEKKHEIGNSHGEEQ